MPANTAPSHSAPLVSECRAPVYFDSGRQRSASGTAILTTLILVLISLLSPICSAFADNLPQYRLGPEDVISVSVLRHPEFSGDFFVTSDGSISIPVAGRVAAAGLTLGELADNIRQSLDSQLVDPDVVASLKTPRMQRVYVLGPVKSPGFFESKPGWRLTEALAAAGGITQGVEPAHCKVTILRARTGDQQTVGLPDIMDGNAQANLTVDAGDVITVDDGEIAIYVTGKVAKPGLCRIPKDKAGIMEAIAAASGVMSDSALTNVTVKHISGASEVVNLAPSIISGVEAPNVKLQSGDMILVPECTSRIATLGWVKSPGVYPMQDGKDFMLSDAIGLAGGIDNKRARIDEIAVIRKENGKEQRLVVNYKKFLKTGDVAQNPKLIAGDVVYVPETSKPDWDFITRTMTSVALMINYANL